MQYNHKWRDGGGKVSLKIVLQPRSSCRIYTIYVLIIFGMSSRGFDSLGINSAFNAEAHSLHSHSLYRMYNCILNIDPAKSI